MKRATRAGFTLVEIMIVVAIIALLAAIAIPNVLRGRTTANESASIGNLRALLSSLEMYRSVYQAYPGSSTVQSDMYTVPTPDYGPPSFDRPLDGSNPGSVVQGYKYTYASGSADVYTLNADPVTTNTGSRAFFVSQEGLIRHCSGASGAASTDRTIDQPPDNC